jgi:hypothetical protein
LIRVCQQIQGSGRLVCDLGPARNVRRVFEMTGVIEFLMDNGRKNESLLP